MNSRKAELITVKTGDVGTSPGRFTGETCQTWWSAACGDRRLIGGWSSWEAGVFNAGTLPGDAKRKVSSGGPARAKVSMRQVRAESLVVVLKAGETRKERRGDLL